MAYSNVKFSAVLEGFIRKIREEPNLTYDVCGETARLNKHRECVCVCVGVLASECWQEAWQPSPR